jgi:hypothetical protein
VAPGISIRSSFLRDSESVQDRSKDTCGIEIGEIQCRITYKIDKVPGQHCADIT